MINWIFRFFVFLLPTQLALHFWPDWALVFGIRVDYLAPAIYLTDLAVGVLLVLFVTSNKVKPKINRRSFFLIGLISLFALTNTSLALSPQAALIKWAKVVEMVLLVVFLKKTKTLNFEKDFFLPLFISAGFFSFLGIMQSIKGGTLGGPLYFLGERMFSLSSPGISKFFVEGREYLSAYSTFSHPNSLAGYLSVVLILLLTKKKQTLPKWVKFTVFILVVSAFLLTVSLAAFGALFVILLIYLFSVNKGKLFSNRLGKTLLILVVFISLFFPYGFNINYESFSESLTKRIELAQASHQIFLQAPLFGIGLNNFIPALSKIPTSSETSWFLQPVHNIYLLFLTEAGVFGLSALILVLWVSIKASLNRKNPGVFLSLCFIVVVGVFDHYFLTLQQNILLFSVILGYSLKDE